MRWYAGSNSNTLAYADGVGAGKGNNTMIILNQSYGDGNTYAARVCNEYTVTVNGVTYGDWYLPSKDELNLLYLQKAVVGNFAVGPGAYYWSSTEGQTLRAYLQYFDGAQTGTQSQGDKSYALYVRAIRAF
jgi:hypothetical protein